MYKDNNVLIERILDTLATEYQITEACDRNQLTRDELINKLIIAETIVKVFEERIRVLKWENNIWNSSDGFRLVH